MHVRRHPFPLMCVIKLYLATSLKLVMDAGTIADRFTYRAIPWRAYLPQVHSFPVYICVGITTGGSVVTVILLGSRNLGLFFCPGRTWVRLASRVPPSLIV